MTIKFPNIEAMDEHRMVVLYPAEQDNKCINCAISTQALEDNFNGNNVPALDCFRRNRGFIELKTARLIENGRFEPDGSILIRSRDGP